MSTKLQHVVVAGILVICVGGAFALSIYRGGGQPAQVAGTSQPASADAPTPVGGQVLLGNGLAKYSSQPYHFSIQYHDTLQAQEHREEVGGPLAVLIATKDGSQFLRVFAVPYNQPTVSKERFLTDLPSGVMKNSADVTVAGAKGTMFESRDPLIGDSIEIWFIHTGILYEVDAPLSQAQWLQGIMGSWKFL